MKIIGGHDFYDGAGMGVDESIVFVRKERQILDAPFELPMPVWSYPNERHKLRFFYLLVGGEIIPGAKEEFPHERVTINGKQQWHQEPTRFHYDLDSAIDAIDRIYQARGRRVFRGLRNEMDDATRHFTQEPGKAVTDWVIENRVITGHVFLRRIYDEQDKKHSRRVQVDADIDTLASFELYKIMDPSTVHMRIANFIGGVLPHSTETSEIPNEFKIIAAGHDPVASFRTPKGAKKPRRRKT